MCVSTIGSFHLFAQIVENHSKHTSRVLVFWILSDFLFLCLFLLFIEDNFFGRGGRPPLPSASPPSPPSPLPSGPMAVAAVTLMVPAPKAPRRAAPGPMAAAVALTGRMPWALRRAAPGPTAAAPRRVFI